MSQGRIFSANLAKLCAGEPDVMTVCRATKINRQQFQRYLSGTVPYKTNLDKICRYFGVKPSDMFVEPADGETDIAGKAWWSHIDVRAALKLIHSDARPSIPAGLYFTYFANPDQPGAVARSATIIRHDSNLTTFRRVTGAGERKGSWWWQFFGDHKGIVIERAHWLYFLALNSRGNREPTLLVTRWLPGSRFMLGGHALISGAPGPMATAVVVAPCGAGVNLAAAVRASRVHSSRDIDTTILEYLEREARTLAERSATLPGLVEGPLAPASGTDPRQHASPPRTPLRAGNPERRARTRDRSSA